MIYAAALLAVTPVLCASLTAAKFGYLLVAGVFGGLVYVAALVATGVVGSSEASFLRKNILIRLPTRPQDLITVEKHSL